MVKVTVDIDVIANTAKAGQTYTSDNNRNRFRREHIPRKVYFGPKITLLYHLQQSKALVAFTTGVLQLQDSTPTSLGLLVVLKTSGQMSHLTKQLTELNSKLLKIQSCNSSHLKSASGHLTLGTMKSQFLQKLKSNLQEE